MEAGGAEEIDVAVGQFVTVRTRSKIGRSIIGAPEVASLVPLGERSLNVLGNAPGMTNVSLYDQDGDIIGTFNVEVGPNTDDLARALAQAHPRAKIDVQRVNGRIRLAGTVPNAPALQDILAIAAEYTTDNIINSMTVKGSQQVMLEVRFVEASRNAGRELGLSVGLGVPGGNVAVVGATSAIQAGDTPPFGSTLQSGNAPFGSLLVQILGSGISADVLIQALESKGLARRLAEPNLTALSGSTASFLAGGEIPIPVNEDEGVVTVTYKEFGVRLNFTPVVLDDGTINIAMEHEVSQVDPTTTVRTGTIEVPSFATRRATTTVDLRDGQSFAIAGLLQATNTRTEDQVPYVGSLPVIGALFRSASFQKQETDLVIIVTPHLVQPATLGQPLKTPLDSTRSSNDAQLFLLGLLEVDKDMLEGFAKGSGVIGPYGHIIELPPETRLVTKN